MRKVLPTIAIALALHLLGCYRTGSGHDPLLDATKGQMIGAGLAVAVVVGVIVVAFIAHYRSASADEEPQHVPTDAMKRVAAAITSATAAARVGDCATVVRLAPEVERLKPDFYEAVFLDDVAIARCLANPAAPEMTSVDADPANAVPTEPGLPQHLDRASISDGLDKVKATVLACDDQSPVNGTITVSVKVAPDGHVAAVTIKSTPDRAVGDCVAAVIQQATFAKTSSGSSFNYPFVFRAETP